MTTKKEFPKGTLVLFISFVALISAVYFSQQASQKIIPQELMSVMRPQPHALVPFTLTDQYKKDFTKENLKGKWSFLFFGYTFCPDVCPTTLTTLTQIDKILKKNYSASADTQVIFVSVDPDRDTPDILKKYTAYFNPEFIAVTGAADVMSDFSRQFAAAYIKEPANKEGDYLVSHTSSIFLVNPEMQIVAAFSPPLDVETITSQYIKIHDMF